MEKNFRLSISVFSGNEYESAKFAASKIKEAIISMGINEREGLMAEFSFDVGGVPPIIHERRNISKNINIDELCNIEDFVNKEMIKRMENLES